MKTLKEKFDYAISNTDWKRGQLARAINSIFKHPDYKEEKCSEWLFTRDRSGSMPAYRLILERLVMDSEVGPMRAHELSWMDKGHLNDTLLTPDEWYDLFRKKYKKSLPTLSHQMGFARDLIEHKDTNGDEIYTIFDLMREHRSMGENAKNLISVALMSYSNKEFEQKHWRAILAGFSCLV